VREVGRTGPWKIKKAVVSGDATPLTIYDLGIPGKGESDVESGVRSSSNPRAGRGNTRN